MMNTDTGVKIFRKYGEKKKGVNNKFYEVVAEELEDGRASWAFRWGRIGTEGQSKSGTSYSFSAAKQKCEAQFALKEKRGYGEVGPLEALASCCEEPEERPNRGLSAVEIDVPCWHAGKSNARLDKFAGKYLKKLNIIRASFNDLSSDAYRKQIETLFKQYWSEFFRTKATATHGPNMDDHALIAAKIFFGALQRDAGTTVYAFYDGVGVL